MDQKDEAALNEKFKDMKSQLRLIQQKYEKLSRFQAENFIKESDGQIKVIDSFIEENDAQTNIHLKAAAKAVHDAEEANFLRQGNPYYVAYTETSAALRHMFVAKAWQNQGFDIQNFEIDKMLQIIQETRDTELETQKLELERAMREQFMQHYEGAVKDRDRQILALTRQATELIRQLNSLGLVVPPQEEEAEEEQLPVAQMPVGEKPQLSNAEQTAFNLRPTQKSKAKFLIEIHKEWPDRVISEYSGLPIENVALLRKQIELGEKV